MLAIDDTHGGALLRVRVSAGAGHTGVTGAHAGALKIAVAQAPEKGRANREVLKVLARALGLGPGDLEIVRGQTSRDKLVFVRGRDAATLRANLVTFDAP